MGRLQGMQVSGSAVFQRGEAESWSAAACGRFLSVLGKISPKSGGKAPHSKAALRAAGKQSARYFRSGNVTTAFFTGFTVCR
jgi:hypothetical protein